VSRVFPDEMSEEELSAYRGAAKEALRKRLAALRRTLTSEARAERSTRACEHLIAHAGFDNARVVLAYAALRFELDPQHALAQAAHAGKTLLLPRVVPESHELTLHVYKLGDELSESGFGVREPLASAERVAHEQVDLVLVPALAFDARGYRLGYGKGFYDRLLPTLGRAERIGLAFELSLLPQLPNEEHDIAVHRVVTEKRVLEVAP
jgi:5-formyltetrahydrofolate cyclo-ligase